MSHVNHEHVEESLRELADEGEQRRLWTASSGEVSSLTEAMCHLFDDSGLGDALEREAAAYSWAIDSRLRLLDDLLRSVDEHLPVADLLAHPVMVQVRTVAAALLADINNLRHTTDE